MSGYLVPPDVAEALTAFFESGRARAVGRPIRIFPYEQPPDPHPDARWSRLERRYRSKHADPR